MGDYGDMREFTTPDSADLLRAGRGLEAMQRVKDQMPAWQLMARIWPGQFREAVAHQLMNMSMALLAIHRDMRPVHRAAPEAVEVLCLRGQLLCDLSRPAEAAQPLARASRAAYLADGSPGIMTSRQGANWLGRSASRRRDPGSMVRRRSGKHREYGLRRLRALSRLPRIPVSSGTRRLLSSQSERRQLGGI